MSPSGPRLLFVRRRVPALRAVLMLWIVVGIGLVGAAQASAKLVRVGVSPRLPSGARVVGVLPAPSALQATVTLEPPNPGALASYATAVSTPGNVLYRRYLTPAQFAVDFGPSVAQISAVRGVLRVAGLSPSTVSANGLSIEIHGSAGTFSKAFGTGFKRYRLASGRVAYANTSAPLLPAPIASTVQGVVGLDNLVLAHSNVVTARSARRTPKDLTSTHVVTGGPQPCADASALAASGGPYTADQLASAYSFSSLYEAGDLGAGQTVALYELESDAPSDIAAYQTCYGTGAVVSYVKVDGGAGTGPGSGEASLDIENVISAAPKAADLVYQAPNTGSGAIDDWTAIISQDQASIVSTSFGTCEPDSDPSAVNAENTLFQEAATQGQSIVDAAGDAGSEDCSQGQPTQETELAADDPAGQPFITAVGGTTLTSVGPPPVQTVWNDGSQGGGGGGGISEFFGMPSYQSGAPASLHVINAHSSGTPCGAKAGSFCRETPDVALDADENTGFVVYQAGVWGTIGGTSGAAPLFAAFLAVTNASSACRGTDVGFVNPTLYRIAGSSVYSSDFYDITSGNNDYLGIHGGLYPSGAGYDMASGLGSPNGTALPAALCDKVTVDNPGTQTTAVGSSVSLPVIATSSSSASLQYTATGLPAGLSINSSTGAITGVATAGGTSSVEVVASTSDGASASASFTWTIVAASVTVSNPGAQGGTVGNAASLQVSATDNNGGTLTYAATGLPTGLAINPTTGLVSGTLTAAGTFAVTLNAQDGAAQGSAAFTWTVTPAAIITPPRGATVDLTDPGNQTGAVGSSVSLQIGAADSDGGALSYSSTGLPAGLSINPSTGLISGTPTTSAAFSVTVKATDASGPAATATFAWTIAKAASAVRYSLSGVAKRRTELSVTLAAATGSPNIESISIGLPKGLSFSKNVKKLLARIGLRSSTGKRVKFTANVSHGRLKINLNTSQARVKVTISSTVLLVSESLASKVAHKHVTSVSVVVNVTNSTNTTTQLTLKIRV